MALVISFVLERSDGSVNGHIFPLLSLPRHADKWSHSRKETDRSGKR